MNMNLLPALCLALAISFNTAMAQTSYSLEDATASATVPSRDAKPVPRPATNLFSHKKMPQMFSGYAIEVATSTYPLDGSNGVFRRFGNVLYEKQREGGYSYLIRLNFSSKEAALHFLEQVIKPRSEDAKLYEYNEGARKVVRD